MDLIDLSLKEMRERKDIHGETYTPYFPTSYALHHFNLLNQDKQIFYEGKQIANRRLHLLFVGSPMSSKSFYLENMSYGDEAIFKNTGYEMSKQSTITEAGLCGSFVMSNGSMTKQPGQAEVHKNDFLIIDEFSAIVGAFKQTYNASMEAQMLAALDHGNVSKSLGAGHFGFKTHCSIWAGVQPNKLRMDGDSGLGRRICFLVNIPDEKQRDMIQEAMFNSQNVRPEPHEINNMRDQIQMWKTNANEVKYVEYESSVLRFFKDTKLDPLHQPLAQSMILGYHLARERWQDDGEMYMNVNDQMLKDMILRSLKWFKAVRAGPDVMQLRLLIKAYGTYSADINQYVIDKSDIMKYCGTISMSIRDVNERLQDLFRFGLAYEDPVSKTVLMHNFE